MKEVIISNCSNYASSKSKGVLDQFWTLTHILWQKLAGMTYLKKIFFNDAPPPPPIFFKCRRGGVQGQTGHITCFILIKIKHVLNMFDL